MIEELKNLSATFLEYNMHNLFCNYLDEGKLNSARLIIEDVNDSLAEQLVNAHLYGLETVISFQYTNLVDVDTKLTNMVIEQAENQKQSVNDS